MLSLNHISDDSLSTTSSDSSAMLDLGRCIVKPLTLKILFLSQVGYINCMNLQKENYIISLKSC